MAREITKINTNLQTHLWNGTVPVEITLNPSDLTDLTAPPPLYLQVPRTSLWSHVLSSIFSHFGPHTFPVFTTGLSTTAATYDLENTESAEVAELTSCCWLETSDGRAINWSVPVGVTTDIIVNKPTTSEVQVMPIFSSTQPNPRFPLKLTAHFSKYPASLLPHTLAIVPPAASASSSHAVYTHVHMPSTSHRTHVLSVVKQACAILYGSPGAAFSLPTALSNALVLFPYHPVPCLLARSQETISATARTHKPITAACKDISQWKEALLALDGYAYKVWRTNTHRSMESLEAEVVREERRKQGKDDGEAGKAALSAGEATPSAEDKSESSPSGENPETPSASEGGEPEKAVAAAGTLHSLESMKLHAEELRQVLDREYSTAVDIDGPHFQKVPVRVYVSAEYNNSSRRGQEAAADSTVTDVGRSRFISGRRNQTVQELAEGMFDAKLKYGQDVVFMAHGIELDGSMPLNWAYMHFRNPDLWLHLVTLRKTNKSE